MNLSDIASATGGVAVGNQTTASHNPADILETAMDAFFASVQKQTGHTTGDLAGEWYANNDTAVAKLLLPYVNLEIKHGE